MEAGQSGAKKDHSLADPALVAEHVPRPAAAAGAGVLIGVFNFVVKLVKG